MSDPTDLSWITPPPTAAWEGAVNTLHSIGAVDDAGRITNDGRRIARLGAHPRLGRMMIEAERAGVAELGTVVAAVVESGARGDLCRAVERPDRDVQRVARQWLRSMTSSPTGGLNAGHDDSTIGWLVACAFPERVARRREGDRLRYLTAAGIGVSLPADSPLAGSEWLAIAELDRRSGADEAATSAAPLAGDELDGFLQPRLERRATVTTTRDGVLTGTSTWNLGAIVVRTDRSATPSHQDMAAAAAKVILERGIGLLRWSDAAHDLQRRALFARSLDAGIPDCSDTALADEAHRWLPPLLGAGPTVRLGDIPAGDVLHHVLDWSTRRRIDELAPTDLPVPSGRRHRVDYTPEGPVMRVKLQEMFGAERGPAVGDGRVPVTLHLLSPAGRPLQVTQDLASFWAGSYASVRSEMRGRYPRHPWPDDPAAATPTASVLRRRST